MTLQDACRILADTHTRPSTAHGVIVEMSRMPKRGAEDEYVEAWTVVRNFAESGDGPR